MDNTERLLPVEKAVLAVIYLQDQISGSSIKAEEILSIVADKTNIVPNRIGFGRLRSSNLVETYDSEGIRYYSVTSKGRDIIESSFSLDGELRAIVEAIDGQIDPDAFAPAADRTVRLDHNSQLLGDLKNGVEKTIDEIRKQNDLSDEDLRYAAELRASLELVQSPIVSAELVERTLVKALKYFSEKFLDNAVGMAAGAALTLAIQLFG